MIRLDLKEKRTCGRAWREREREKIGIIAHHGDKTHRGKVRQASDRQTKKKSFFLLLSHSSNSLWVRDERRKSRADTLNADPVTHVTHRRRHLKETLQNRIPEPLFSTHMLTYKLCHNEVLSFRLTAAAKHAKVITSQQ